jgi:hypothetical protein
MLGMFLVGYIFIFPFDDVLRDICKGYHQDVTSSIFCVYFQLLLLGFYFKKTYKVGQGMLDLGF